MGARSSPEGSRVAAGRYGLPVRNRAAALRPLPIRGALVVPVVLTALLAVLLAACSGSGGGNATPTAKGKPVACTYVAKLDSIAATVAATDVRNPDLFNETFAASVQDYVKNVRSLRSVAPADLSASLARVEADVQQYRFDAALTDSAPLDAYAARACGRAATVAPITSATTATTAAPSLTAPVSSTTLPGASDTTTTAPSDG